MEQSRHCLDPKLDTVFWRLFGAEQNRPVLIGLLSAILRPASPIIYLELLHPEPQSFGFVEELTMGEHASRKRIALDLRVRLANGEQVDIEMQTQRRAGLTERMVYYLTRMHASQLDSGDDYLRLNPAVVILLANFKLFGRSRFHSSFSLREDLDGDRLTEQIAIHVIELPKVAPSPARKDEPELVLWAKFFNAKSDNDLEQIAMQHPNLKRAKDALQTLSDDPKVRIEAERQEMADISYRLELSISRDEGRAEGRTEGVAAGRAEGVAAGRAEGVAAGRAEGVAAGRAETLLTIMDARGLAVTDEQRERIRRCRDVQQLEAWTRRTVTASRADELFG